MHGRERKMNNPLLRRNVIGLLEQKLGEQEQHKLLTDSFTLERCDSLDERSISADTQVNLDGSESSNNLLMLATPADSWMPSELELPSTLTLPELLCSEL